MSTTINFTNSVYCRTATSIRIYTEWYLSNIIDKYIKLFDDNTINKSKSIHGITSTWWFTCNETTNKTSRYKYVSSLFEYYLNLIWFSLFSSLLSFMSSHKTLWHVHQPNVVLSSIAYQPIIIKRNRFFFSFLSLSLFLFHFRSFAYEIVKNLVHISLFLFFSAWSLVLLLVYLCKDFFYFLLICVFLLLLDLFELKNIQIK